MSKIIVTGGAGFIGSNLTDKLIERGDEVIVIDNLSGGKKEQINPKAIFHQLDITNLKSIKPIFTGFDYVFHLAALPQVFYSIDHPVETNEINATGTLNVLLAAKEAGVKKVIYSASASVYGVQEKMPLREDAPALPNSPYGLQKYIGELYCQLFSEIYDLPTVRLRYFNVFGPRQSEEGAYALVVAKFLKQRREGQALTIIGDGTQTRDFVNVRDVVRANILAMEKDVPAGEVLNIGSGVNSSVKTIADLIGGDIEYLPARLELHDSLADNAKARNLLGWVPEVGLEEGIAELKKLQNLK
ncbi:MAG: NAD-dependent epimerase/dehydratase family protein [Candidatus Paceibacterota bacterium]|jgi:UDP-glucose 4-epimerase